MANKKIFQSGSGVEAIDISSGMTTNHAGGFAYEKSAKATLAQLASTGCFNDTFYVSGADQLKTIKSLLSKVDPEFIAKTAIYARERGYMRDMPSALLASLASTRSDLFAKVFPRIVDNTKMLRNVVQMIRSGEFGRKSLGTRPKRVVQNWLSARDDRFLFRGSVGSSPSLGDVIKMTHPRPESESRKALYGYLTGAMTKEQHDKFMAKEGNAEKKVSSYDPSQLPELVKAFETFKAAPEGMLLPPDVSFEMLTALPLNTAQWKQIAKTASWTQTRMSLNTFARHGVFEDQEIIQLIAQRLADKDLVSKSKVFPYQLMTAYATAEENIPMPIKMALQTAMEHATRNVPTFDGKVVVCVDVSGSMSSPITGHRDGSTSKTRCIDVAALVASVILRSCKDAEIIPFEGGVVDIARLGISADNTVMENARRLASIGGGSTNCSAPLMQLNQRKANASLIYFCSDNESWVDGRGYGYGKTAMMEQWEIFKERNPNARLVCNDLTPNPTSQVQSRKDILQCGGFSDQIFDVARTFMIYGNDMDHWVRTIEAIEL